MRQEVGPGEHAAFTSARGAKYLELTQAQQEKCAGVLQSRREELVALLLGGERPRQLEARVKAFHAETGTRLDALLTPAQRERRKALLSAADRPQFGPSSFPLLNYEIGTYLTSPELPPLLKLTDEQTKKLPDLRRRFREARLANRAGDAKGQEELNKKFDQELVALLGADRRLRFRQIVLQQVERQALARTGRSVVGTVLEVAEALQLSAEQSAKLHEGREVGKVLTGEQQKKWKEMLGEEYRGTLTLAGGAAVAARAPALPARYLYLTQPSVQKELKLTKEQVAEVRGLEAKWQQLTNDHADWMPQERDGKLARATEAMEAHVKQSLQPPQARRLEQILIQNLRLAGRGEAAEARVATISTLRLTPGRGEKGGLAELLAYAPAAKALALSDEQRQQAGAILADFLQTGTLVTRELRQGSTQTDALLTRTRAALREQVEKKLDKLLTQKQRAAVKDLVGEPFTGTLGGRSTGTWRSRLRGPGATRPRD